MLFNALAVSATLLASIGAPLPQAPAAPGSLKFTAPKGWDTRAPSSAMRVGEFAVPGVNGSAELVLYDFGGTGGSVDANIQRWVGQMQQPDGKPTSEVAKRETKTINGLDISLLDVSGTVRRRDAAGRNGETQQPRLPHAHGGHHDAARSVLPQVRWPGRDDRGMGHRLQSIPQQPEVRTINRRRARTAEPSAETLVRAGVSWTARRRRRGRSIATRSTRGR